MTAPSEPRAIEFYYDFSSPNAYFAARTLPGIAARTGARLVPRPFLLGGLFRAIGSIDLPGMSTPAKAAWSRRELDLWSHKYGIPFRFPSRFPLNTVTALRVSLVLEERGESWPWVERAFVAYWVEDVDLSDGAALSSLLEELGHDAGAVLARTQEPTIKEALKARTAEAVERGVFGAPTCYVDGGMFFGKDRLDFVEDALRAT